MIIAEKRLSRELMPDIGWVYNCGREAGAHLHGDGKADASRDASVGEDGRVKTDDVAEGVLLGEQYKL